jgi:hypothetical protein
MTEAQSQQTLQTATTQDETAWQELVQRVAKRVWELWREELRRDRERRGKP